MIAYTDLVIVYMFATFGGEIYMIRNGFEDSS